MEKVSIPEQVAEDLLCLDKVNFWAKCPLELWQSYPGNVIVSVNLCSVNVKYTTRGISVLLNGVPAPCTHGAPELQLSSHLFLTAKSLFLFFTLKPAFPGFATATQPGLLCACL